MKGTTLTDKLHLITISIKLKLCALLLVQSFFFYISFILRSFNKKDHFLTMPDTRTA